MSVRKSYEPSRKRYCATARSWRRHGCRPIDETYARKVQTGRSSDRDRHDRPFKSYEARPNLLVKSLSDIDAEQVAIACPHLALAPTSRDDLEPSGVTAVMAQPRCHPSVNWPAALIRQGDVRHETLAACYSRLGGTLTGEDLAARVRLSRDQPVSLVARWLVDRHILGIAWRTDMLIPMFQFSRPASGCGVGDPPPAIRQILVELDAFLDDLSAAEWFASPNTWLQYRTPALLVASGAECVAQAARADRFVANGW